MIEQPCDGIEGFLLQGMDGKYFFRVYDTSDKRKFTDFKLVAEDIEIKLLGNYCSLYVCDDEDNNKIDYSTKVLGK